MGTVLVAVFGTATFGGFGTFNMGEQLMKQLLALAVVIGWSAIATVLIVFVCKKTTGLRVDEEVEFTGLDQAEHGETAYHFE